MICTVIIIRILHRTHIHLINIIHMICAGAMKNLFGDIQIIVITTVVLGMWAMDVGKNGVILIKYVDGNIIKDGVIN